MAHPRGGDWLEGEVHAWLTAGVGLVVSLLESSEVMELDLEAEQSLSLRGGIDFISFPIPDRGIPTSRSEVLELVERLKNSVLRGDHIAIHCRVGIGRSSMVAAMVLISLGAESAGVFQLISKARGLEVPDTPEQAQYALTFGMDPDRLKFITKNSLRPFPAK